MVVPPFASKAVPITAKVVLAVALSLAVAPGMPGEVPLGTGALIVNGAHPGRHRARHGLRDVPCCSRALAAAGSLIDVFGGFSLAQGFDPLGMNSNTVFGKFHQMLATALLFVSGAHLLVIGGLLKTFDFLPLGSSPGPARGPDVFITAFSMFFVTAVQIALPMIAVLFVADLGLALLTKVAPQLNAMAVMFPAKIGLTLMLLGLSFPVLPQALDRMVELALRAMSRTVRSGVRHERGEDREAHRAEEEGEHEGGHGPAHPGAGRLGLHAAVGLALPPLVSPRDRTLRTLFKSDLRVAADPSVAGARDMLGQGLGHALARPGDPRRWRPVIGVGAALAQGGFYLATKAVKPSFTKLNPLKGAKRIFGPQTLWEGAKMLLKASIVAALAWSAVQDADADDRRHGPHGDGDPAGRRPRPVDAAQRRGGGPGDGGRRLRDASAARMGKKTRMTKDEVKQEYKQTEGDPMSRRRSARASWPRPATA